MSIFSAGHFIDSTLVQRVTLGDALQPERNSAKSAVLLDAPEHIF